MCTPSVFQPAGRRGATGYATASGARTAVADTSLHDRDGADAGTNATAGDVVEAAAATDASWAMGAAVGDGRRRRRRGRHAGAQRPVAAPDAGNAVAAPDVDEHADAAVTSLAVHDGAAMDVERGDDGGATAWRHDDARRTQRRLRAWMAERRRGRWDDDDNDDDDDDDDGVTDVLQRRCQDAVGTASRARRAPPHASRPGALLA
jgi:hypothetical protein